MLAGVKRLVEQDRVSLGEMRSSSAAGPDA
jgi:hypothetical protein